jgi:hypothetical protein
LTGVARHDDHDGAVGATSRNLNAEGRLVQLRFLGKETTGGQSPTLYATDQDSYVVQGWIVTNDDVLAKLDLAENETVVEVYSRLLSHLEKDGLSGEVTTETYPIVHITEDGTYVLQGKHLADVDALAQMDIPSHETAIEIPRSVMAELVKGR